MKKLFLPLFAIFLASFLFFSNLNAQEGRIEGFRDLKWGMTIEKAKSIYLDLIISENKAVSDKCFIRKKENKKIGDIEFEKIVYFFNDKFYKVISHIFVVNDKVRMQKVEEDFEIVKKNIESKYGSATEKKKDFIRGLDNVRIKVNWLVGDSKITLQKDSSDIMGAIFLTIECIKPSGKLGF
jgi:hypothetical protein